MSIFKELIPPFVVCQYPAPKPVKESGLLDRLFKEDMGEAQEAVSPPEYEDRVVASPQVKGIPVPDTPKSKPKGSSKSEEVSREAQVHRSNTNILNDTLNKGITLKDNLSGNIVEITLPIAGTEIAIRHNLKVTPKYRIILKHKGDGIIQDGDTAWNSTTAYFKSSQATEEIKATIILMRG